LNFILSRSLKTQKSVVFHRRDLDLSDQGVSGGDKP
jgi:hypothetical protein